MNATMNTKLGESPHAQSCGGKCRREIESCVDGKCGWNQNIMGKIHRCYVNKQLVLQTSNKIKHQVNTEINELIEILKKRKEELCLEVDEESLDQFEDIDTHIAELCNYGGQLTALATSLKSDDCICSEEVRMTIHTAKQKFAENFPKSKLAFTSNFKELKAGLQKYGELSLHDFAYKNFEDYPGSSVPKKTREERHLHYKTNNMTMDISKEELEKTIQWESSMLSDMSSSFEEASKSSLCSIEKDDEMTVNSAAKDHEKLLEPQSSEFEKGISIVYRMNCEEAKNDSSMDDDDIEIISPSEATEIPSHSPIIQRKTKKRFMIGQGSVMKLPPKLFRRISRRDSKMQAKNVEKMQKVENPSYPVDLVLNSKPAAETLSGDERGNVSESCGGTAKVKSQDPSAALMASFNMYFNINPQKWLACEDNSSECLPSRNEPEKQLSLEDRFIQLFQTEESSNKRLNAADSYDKWLHSEESLDSWLPQKNSSVDTSWLSAYLQQCAISN